LLELLAWLAEMDIYQINRVPDRHRRKFLALISLRPEPPQPAHTVLSLTVASDQLRLPIGTQFEGSDLLGFRTRFRIMQSIDVIAGELKIVQVHDGQRFLDVTGRWQRQEPIGLFGSDPRPDAALYLGFSQPLPTDAVLSLYFAFDDWLSSEVERQRLQREAEAQTTICRAPIGLTICANDSVADETAAPPAHHSARTIWEYLAADGRWTLLDPTRGEAEDDTRSFTLNGVVRLGVPRAMQAQAIGASTIAGYYLRCRFVAGAYDAAPLCRHLVPNGVVAEQAVPAGVLTWDIAAGTQAEGTAPAPGESAAFTLSFSNNKISQLRFGEDAPAFMVLGYRAATDTQTGSLSIAAELAARGSGSPQQRVTLAESPIIESSLRLFTLEDNHWRVWELKSDFDDSRRDDAHFTLDAQTGTITFGDGEHGRVPPPAAAIIAAYDTTRGVDGNLDRNHVTQLAESAHNLALLRRAGFADLDAVRQRLTAITNVLPATGGAAAETMTQAAARAFDRMESNERAVTLTDYETLAQRTPGTRVARAAARANLHPGFPCFAAPGLITLIILPYLPQAQPQPSAGLQRSVAAYLARRHVIGTHVEVIGPSYLEVIVRATVKPHQGADPIQLQQRIVQALEQFFDPLSGGPAGTGWPFGRDVYRSEVLQLIDEIPGVDHVLTLELSAGEGEAQCGNLCLRPEELVDSGPHQIDVIRGPTC
jgi:predicted phage baseplate assembly protein